MSGGFSITVLSADDIPPQNDPAWDKSNGVYTIVRGQPFVRIPYINEHNLEMMSIKDLMNDRVEIYNKLSEGERNAHSADTMLMYENLATSDAIIGNYEKGEVKIVHNNPIVKTISGKSKYMSWKHPGILIGKAKTDEELEEFDKKHPSRYLEVTERDYNAFEGVVIPSKYLDTGLRGKGLTDHALRNEFFSYILEGDMETLERYLEQQKSIVEGYGDIPIRLSHSSGLQLLNIAGILFRNGPVQSTIGTTYLGYFSSDIATKTEKEK